MNLLQLPWLEMAVGAAVLGSLWVSMLRDPNRAYRAGLTYTAVTLFCALMACVSFYMQPSPDFVSPWSVQPRLFERQIFLLDELSAPLVPIIAMVHFLMALSTAQTKMRRFSFSWSLAAEAIQILTFSCKEPWILIALLVVSTVPPYIELVNRGRPTRVYSLHMTLFVVLLVVGYWMVERAQMSAEPKPSWVIVPLLAAILVRCGTIPAHCWITDWFEHTSLGIGLLYMLPLSGVYAAVRLVLPIAPGWVLSSIGTVSLVTAVYAAGMGIVQSEARRFFAYLFISHSSLVLVGLELHTELSLTGSLSLWFSVLLSLGGFGISLRALEARFGRLSLSDFHGLYGHSPTLAVCFLLTGLASVGFPATLGFIATEVLVDSAVEASPLVGIIVVAAGALNGIAVMRAYFYLFTGARHASTISLIILRRERVALLILAALIIAGGMFPQPGVYSRQRATDEILLRRHQLLPRDEEVSLPKPSFVASDVQ